ncbi:MAG: L-aminoadipate-semialdehyde dehydrogenase-phosphopantetheinyl transferase [Streblomastix strix]|uniref:holo-[acyl-carrier-protein] synthase n=1 Tax=Streblomastix strix TaxID=222440 RepID=A0A5J4X1L8_9EUKA|nr:MAG: L-aminoadipate-semialdehyde dehydrogenase-phosphopantetheinyl transferase [Streblomastix strix]
MDLFPRSQRGRYRICVSSENWKINEKPKDSTSVQFERALQLIDDTEKQRILKFFRIEDKKSALLGRLILNSMICSATGISNKDLVWHRTDKGKPYIDQECLESSIEYESVKNISYNISHSGKWVVGASELNIPVGIDVNDIGLRPNCKIDFDADDATEMEVNQPIVKKYLKNFSNIFSPLETEQMKMIRFESAQRQLQEFSRYWTCKEAFVKVSGEGFGFDVKRLSFDFSHLPIPEETKYEIPDQLEGSKQKIKLNVDNKDISYDWDFEVFQLDRNHQCSVALHVYGLSESQRSSLHPISLHLITPLQLIEFLEQQ